MDNALNALFYPFDTQQAQPFAADAKVLFIHGRYAPQLSGLRVHCIQPFKPYADEIERAADLFSVHADFDEGVARDYDAVFILLPKNKVEAEYALAQGFTHLRDGGRLICAADNKAGGSNIAKHLKNFGFEDVEVYSKYKARCAVVVKDSGSLNSGAIESALVNGAAQSVLDGAYVSQPGVYGWDKIDRGSAILIKNLPQTLGGVVADFGCGYGYLSCELGRRFMNVSALAMIDADARALSCAAENIDAACDDLDVDGLWMNLTVRQDELNGRFDNIVMNPPFHEGKKTDIAVGISFINGAYSALKNGGTLYMVANTHLPYEMALNDRFKKVDKLYEGGGFKVYAAKK